MSMAFETIILRFRDLVTAEGETIKKHIAVVENCDYVWWGWWKKGNEKTPMAEFATLKIIANTNPTDIYLVDSGQSLVYRATCVDIELRAGEKIASPAKEKTPEYYQDQEYCAWFKLTKIEHCEPACLSDFSYVDCKELFCDSNVDYSRFDNKKIYSVPELIQQNRTVWFIKKAQTSDRDNEIVLLSTDIVQPSHFSEKYHQASGDTLIWLSDLHLPDGTFPFTRGMRRPTLAQHLTACVKNCNVAGLLISGDITSCAKEEGFQQAQQLLKDINLEIPGLNSENILICPGNHDFAREDSLLSEDTMPPFIYEKPENAAGFSAFYRSIYKLSPNKFYASGKKFLLTSGHVLEIAALNSLMLQQYSNFDGHGYLSQEQLEYVAEEMGWNRNNYQNAVRMVMMHHHYLPACYTEAIDVTRASSVVYDANRLMNWLIKYRVKVLIHGHKHQSFVSQVGCPIRPEDDIMISNLPHIAVVGMGGTGAAKCENKFAMIHFEQNEMVIEFHRIHSDESAPDSICQVVKILYE